MCHVTSLRSRFSKKLITVWHMFKCFAESTDTSFLDIQLLLALTGVLHAEGMQDQTLNGYFYFSCLLKLCSQKKDTEIENLIFCCFIKYSAGKARLQSCNAILKHSCRVLLDSIWHCISAEMQASRSCLGIRAYGLILQLITHRKTFGAPLTWSFDEAQDCIHIEQIAVSCKIRYNNCP